jgi:hypothetical protein
LTATAREKLNNRWVAEADRGKWITADATTDVTGVETDKPLFRGGSMSTIHKLDGRLSEGNDVLLSRREPAHGIVKSVLVFGPHRPGSPVQGR